ncbi:hypothetical protein BSG8_07340 [Bacillus subtilis subsp. natto]|nr:hypothetical protein BsBEST3136_07220 [Bacillus subtilis]BCV99332.1 hypothetical protein BsBEST3145_07280 [Bacillus subtilis]BDB91982.1 hypothetical protein BSG8_07340 [Bacillus subtilis subsp. natto]BEH04734.1 hypothetical protein BSNN_07670 [Bacillus subtilis subsp. natto]
MSLGLLLNMNTDIHGLALAAVLFRALAAAPALALAAVLFQALAAVLFQALAAAPALVLAVALFQALAAAPALVLAAVPAQASAVRRRDLLLPKYQRNPQNRRVLKEPFC